ncbi:MAG: alpha/beta hydrolase [Rhodospirillales bacterium]|jgi:pimeloyl-ACP methyl ester carboxylesterase|nr:alpha/beta hydrolase [Rhodospirillales bacterium]MBT4007111.1 alpha/beta hydrolase [Rhodospirillales bacterium]MBT5076127.1 alpha/beta hydrolase [Rhodospirillales bacterium]MBT5113444.1 alpha/beta hydrolase [Rhodospirillales bacterium]MBT5673742.1 alpha/beta hydrolase [Rhodospirillales bacterium]
MTAPKINRHTITVNGPDGGRGVDVVEMGDGAPLVYLHGFADLHGVMENPAPFHEGLSINRRLIAPAHPGCAGTDEYKDLDEIEDAVFHYLDVFDAMGLDQFDLVGHCMGGWIAAEIAVRHPEKINNLVLIGASGLFVKGASIGDLFMMAQPARGVDYCDFRHMLFSDSDHEIARALYPNGRGEMEDEVRRYQMLRFGSFIGFKPPYFYNRPLVDRLHRVTCPALVLWGEKDHLVPISHGEAYANGLRGASGLQVVKGVGHAAHLEDPLGVGALVSGFLG